MSPLYYYYYYQPEYTPSPIGNPETKVREKKKKEKREANGVSDANVMFPD